jgi:hypothetical protein
MKKRNVFYLLLPVLFLAVGCLEQKAAVKKEPETPEVLPAATPSFEEIQSQNNEARQSFLSGLYTADDLSKAIRAASLKLVNRPPTSDELTKARQGLAQYNSVIDSYLEAPEFYTQLKRYFQDSFEMAGVVDNINHDEPANLAVYLVKNNIDYREVITADYCVDNNLNKIACSSFSKNPADANNQAAGAITTQAFLKKWASAFNFFRTREIMQNFACKNYPNENEAGMKAEEIAGSAEVATFNLTSGSPACYNCHKSMNPVASLFFSFDRKGFFNAIPNDNRAANEKILRVTTQVAKVEDLLVNNVKPEFHGEEITSIRDYASKLSNNQIFRDCVAQRFSQFILNNSHLERIPPELEYLRNLVPNYGYKVKPILKEVLQSRSFVLVR